MKLKYVLGIAAVASAGGALAGSDTMSDKSTSTTAPSSTSAAHPPQAR